MSAYIEAKGGEADRLLQQLQERMLDPEPLLLVLGEELSERAKERFDTSTDPAGVPWKLNSPATLAAYIRNRGGKAPGARRQGAVTKKPLIGESGVLRKISYSVQGQSVVIGSSRRWLFMLNFGGRKADYPNLWGDIPARAILPLRSDGSAYPAEEEVIIEEIRHYLTVT